MQNSDLSSTVTFKLNVTPKVVRFKDTTDYAGLSKNVNYVYGNVKITAPSGVIFNNVQYDADADIIGSSGTMYKDFVLPLDGEYVVQGDYEFVYTIYYIDGVNIVEEYTKTFSFTYSFTEPTIDVSFNIDGYNSTFEATDNTTYITSGYSALTASRTIVTTPPTGSGMSTDTDTSTDTTTTLKNSYSANIYAGEYSTTLTISLTYTMSDGLVIVFEGSTTETDNAYNISMDTMKDVLYIYITSYYTAKGTDGLTAEELEESLHKIASSLTHYTLSLDYQDLESAYDSALRVYKILYENATITVEEIEPFVNNYSFTNTDEKVKMTSGGTAAYLADFVDGTTIQNNSGVLSIVGSLSDYVSKANGGTFENDITVDGTIFTSTYSSVEWNTAYTHSQLTTGNPHSVTASDLSLVIGTDVLAYDAGLQNLAGIIMGSDKFYYTTADNTHAAATVTAFARSILDDADEATFKATVNLEIGTDVLAYQAIGIADNNLLEVDGTPSSGEYAIFTANGINGITGANLASDIVGSLLHNSLGGLDSGSTYLHLTSAQKTIATQAASGSQNGYLTSTDWTTFNSKQASLTAGTGITIVSTTISTDDTAIDHDNLLNYDVAQHREINDSGTSATELWSASKINSELTALSIVYKIVADDGGGGTLTGRTFTTVPSGWTVDDSATVNYGYGLGSTNTSLTIQHNLGKHCASVVVKVNDGSVYQEAQGSIAYSSWYDSSDLNAIELTGFCTENYSVEIILVF